MQPAYSLDQDFKEATYEDLCRVPEHLIAEIIDGELITSPRPAFRHGVTSSNLGGDLTLAFGRGGGNDGGNGPQNPGGWWILDEPELHFGKQVLVPDLAGWRRERLPQIPDVAYLSLAPDFICEVLSPSTARIDRLYKMRIYAEEKVSFLWLIDPILKVLEIYQLETHGWHLVNTLGGNTKIRAVPFDAVELDMTHWWID